MSRPKNSITKRLTPSARWRSIREVTSVSFALGGGGYAATGLVTRDRRFRALGGAGIALGAGLAKELYDSTDGDFSYKDMTRNALGAGVGVLTAWVPDRILFDDGARGGTDPVAAAPAAPPRLAPGAGGGNAGRRLRAHRRMGTLA